MLQHLSNISLQHKIITAKDSSLNRYEKNYAIS